MVCYQVSEFIFHRSDKVVHRKTLDITVYTFCAPRYDQYQAYILAKLMFKFFIFLDKKGKLQKALGFFNIDVSLIHVQKSKTK